MLAMLTRVSTATGLVSAAGRSYDGHAWEGVQPGRLSFDCGINTTTGCTTNLSTADGGSGNYYKLSVVDLSADAPQLNESAAYFLIQASFGPTSADIATLSADMAPSGDAASVQSALHRWVNAQIALPPSYHRSYYRQRCNPRLRASVGTGSVRLPCDRGSRWHRFAFTSRDIGSIVNVSALSGGGGGFVVPAAFLPLCTAPHLTGTYGTCALVKKLKKKRHARVSCTALCRRASADGDWQLLAGHQWLARLVRGGRVRGR